MKKKTEKKPSMNLLEKLLDSIRNTLMDNGYLLNKRTEKRISKSSKKIAEKAKKPIQLTGKKQKSIPANTRNHVL
jgi:hypothetical protein